MRVPDDHAVGNLPARSLACDGPQESRASESILFLDFLGGPIGLDHPRRPSRIVRQLRVSREESSVRSRRRCRGARGCTSTAPERRHTKRTATSGLLSVVACSRFAFLFSSASHGRVIQGVRFEDGKASIRSAVRLEQNEPALLQSVSAGGNLPFCTSRV